MKPTQMQTFKVYCVDHRAPSDRLVGLLINPDNRSQPVARHVCDVDSTSHADAISYALARYFPEVMPTVGDPTIARDAVRIEISSLGYTQLELAAIKYCSGTPVDPDPYATHMQQVR